MIFKAFLFKASFFLVFCLSSAHAEVSGYQRYLSQKAVENLRTLEASHMVYNVYENFIVPRICQNKYEIKGGKKKEACSLLGHVSVDDFIPLPGDSNGILYQAKENYTQAAYFKHTQGPPPLVSAAPKGYKVSYVGCYKREKIRDQDNSECSLFFAILEDKNNSNLAPILAVKGSSHSEDWNNNLLAGAPILKEFAHVFSVEMFKQLKSGIIGTDEDNVPQDLKGIAQDLSTFFLRRTQRTHRMFFTGHSLGGALAQELARSVFIATRSDLNDRSSGPNIQVVTWNGLSYTSMIGRLKKGIQKNDPVFQAGWNKADSFKLENFRDVFDGKYLSAINFHTADDLLTSFINMSVIGRFLRLKEHAQTIHAGDDVLLLCNRHININNMKGQKLAHSTTLTLKDALYSMGMTRKDSKLVTVSQTEQVERLLPQIEDENQQARHKGTGTYFRDQGVNPEFFEKDGTQNFSRMRIFNEIKTHEKRSQKLTEMYKGLEENQKYFGRLLGDELGSLTLSLY